MPIEILVLISMLFFAAPVWAVDVAVTATTNADFSKLSIIVTEVGDV